MLTFIRYWYLESAMRFYTAYLHAVQTLEAQVAIQETLKHLTEPLFQDYTYQGRAIGIVFRLVRICLGIVGIIALTLGYLFFYLLWLFFPLICLVSLLGAFFGPNITAVVPAASVLTPSF